MPARAVCRAITARLRTLQDSGAGNVHSAGGTHGKRFRLGETSCDHYARPMGKSPLPRGVGIPLAKRCWTSGKARPTFARQAERLSLPLPDKRKTRPHVCRTGRKLVPRPSRSPSVPKPTTAGTVHGRNPEPFSQLSASFRLECPAVGRSTRFRQNNAVVAVGRRALCCLVRVVCRSGIP